MLTPEVEQMDGAIAKAKAPVAPTPGAFLPQQFENAQKPDVHARTTVEEILHAPTITVPIANHDNNRHSFNETSGGRISGTGLS